MASESERENAGWLTRMARKWSRLARSEPKAEDQQRANRPSRGSLAEHAEGNLDEWSRGNAGSSP